jgi:glycopeptide antibiotics resistance protein
MQAYLFPITTSFLTFPFIAVLFTLPFVVYQYRKHGYINKFRVLILYSFLLFLITAYYLVILPLPSTRDILSIQSPRTRHTQLMLFNFIRDIIANSTVVISKPSTYINLFKERAFLQVAFNGILLLPLGVYLRYYFKKDLKTTILITFLVSLFFEITQLTGLYGIYNAPYRLFDVDDLFLNTLGGVIGYALQPITNFILPKVDTLDKNIQPEFEVGYIKRFFAYLIDWVLIGLILPYSKDSIVFFVIVVFAYFILLPYVTNGKTIGKALLKIKIQGRNEKLTFKELFIRYSLLYYGVFGINRLFVKIMNLNKNEYANYLIVFLLVILVYNLVIFINFIYCSIKKKKTLFYEDISHTKNISY